MIVAIASLFVIFVSKLPLTTNVLPAAAAMATSDGSYEEECADKVAQDVSLFTF